jgi:hypothetical protein
MKYLIASPFLEVVTVTFKSVVFKNFKYNVKRYLALFLCNSFTIMVLFMLLDLKYNKEFTFYMLKDVSIDAVVNLTIFIVVLFSIFFVIYSQRSFIKSRNKEFGLFLTLGMGKKELNKIIILENIVITLSSLFMGLISGSIFSRLFFLAIIKISNFNKISHHFNVDSYINTSILFILIFLSILIGSLIFMNKLDVAEVIKDGTQRDKVMKYHPMLFLAGIIFLLAAILIIFFKVREQYEYNLVRYLPISIGLCVIGLYIIITQIGSGVLYYLKKYKGVYYSNLLFSNEIYYKFNRNKTIIFSCSLLIGITIFGLGFFYSVSKISLLSVPEMYPYHISYGEVLGINNISDRELNNILEDSETSLVENMNLEFCIYNTKSVVDKSNIRDNIVAIVSQKNLKDCTFSNIGEENKELYKLKTTNIKNGEGILVNLNNGELKDVNQTVFLSLTSNINTYEVNCTDFISENLYYLNLPPCNYIVVVNDEEYLTQKSNLDTKYIGEFHMFSFKEWRNTGAIVSKLETYLNNENSKLPQSLKQDYLYDNNKFLLYSTIELYKSRIQSGNLSNFLAVFISFLFFIASSVMIYFKLYTELEDEKHKYKKLFRIGMNQSEFKHIIYKGLRVVFFAPLILGGIPAYLYLFTTFEIMNFPQEIYIVSCYIFIAYLIFQLLYYFVISRRYVKIIISTDS